MNTVFKDPYDKDENKVKLSTYVSEEDAAILRSVRLVRGTVQITINLLLKQLIHELRQRNITDYTKRREFEEYVSSRYSPPDPSLPRPGEETSRDDGGRVEGGGPKAARGSEPPYVSSVRHEGRDANRSRKGAKRSS